MPERRRNLGWRRTGNGDDLFCWRSLYTPYLPTEQIREFGHRFGVGHPRGGAIDRADDLLDRATRLEHRQRPKFLGIQGWAVDRLIYGWLI